MIANVLNRNVHYVFSTVKNLMALFLIVRNLSQMMEHFVIQLLVELDYDNLKIILCQVCLVSMMGVFAHSANNFRKSLFFKSCEG